MTASLRRTASSSGILLCLCISFGLAPIQVVGIEFTFGTNLIGIVVGFSPTKTTAAIQRGAAANRTDHITHGYPLHADDRLLRNDLCSIRLLLNDNVCTVTNIAITATSVLCRDLIGKSTGVPKGIGNLFVELETRQQTGMPLSKGGSRATIGFPLVDVIPCQDSSSRLIELAWLANSPTDTNACTLFLYGADQTTVLYRGRLGVRRIDQATESDFLFSAQARVPESFARTACGFCIVGVKPPVRGRIAPGQQVEDESTQIRAQTVIELVGRQEDWLAGIVAQTSQWNAWAVTLYADSLKTPATKQQGHLALWTFYDSCGIPFIAFAERHRACFEGRGSDSSVR
jgi:hypothetical protein